jgi:hypothetical protein
MKNFPFFILVFLSGGFLSAQKLDYVWVTGNQNNPSDATLGGGLLDFKVSPPQTSYHYRPHNLYVTNSSICDSSGNLLFYTNGCVIAGADDEILENGDDINPGNAHTLWCETYNYGYSGGPGNSIILPVPDSINQFFLFHKRFMFTNSGGVNIDKLYYTKVDMNQNSGKGKVVEKNKVILSDTLARGEIIAVKHANGKDWWVVTPLRNSNQFYILKFTSHGIVDTFKQTIGILPNSQGEGLGQTVFSPDGSKLYRTYRYNPVMVYSFDRETGTFTQFDTISFHYGDQLVGEIGCAISPSGRFLYLGCRNFLYQLDTWASDISNSQIAVAEWDGFTTPFPTLFYQLQLAPDCKIYGLAGGDTRYYHVIHSPDEPGLSCNVEQRGVKFQTPTGASMPSFPNYRLGPINNPGVPCTATVSVSQPVLPIPDKRVWVFPNPAKDLLSIDYQGIGSLGGQFMMFNAQGQIIKEIALHSDDGTTQLPLHGFSDGVYWYVVPGLGAGKILIQH